MGGGVCASQWTLWVPIISSVLAMATLIIGKRPAAVTSSQTPHHDRGAWLAALLHRLPRDVLREIGLLVRPRQCSAGTAT
jgi:hypothetical protein